MPVVILFCQLILIFPLCYYDVINLGGNSLSILLYTKTYRYIEIGGLKSPKGLALDMQNVSPRCNFSYVKSKACLQLQAFMPSRSNEISYVEQNVPSVGKTPWIRLSITASGEKTTRSY